MLQCTQTCGTGSQVREVRCYLNQAPVADDHCNPRTKHEYLDLIRSCNMEPCRTYPDVMVSAQIRRSFTESQLNNRSTSQVNTRAVNHWMAGEWGECSDWCKMNRTVTCMHAYGNHCPLDKKPKEVRNCCHIKYMGEWEPVSASTWINCGQSLNPRFCHAL